MSGSYRTLSRYHLLARLGGGGMAEVYLAVAKGSGGFNKLQVLKVLRCDQQEMDRAELVRMFQDEARLAARLNHPNIVQSYEVGSENGHDFIAMEYLDGQPLNQVRQRDFGRIGDFPLEMQLFVLCEVLEALEYAHTLTDYDGRPLNIVHRDVSPQNVFVTYAGQTKLVDFGIAKTLDSCQTRVGVVKGKVHYMAPEQIAGQKVDHRADLFSVGVMLWEAIARRRMHDKDSVYEIMRKVAMAELPRIRDVVSDVPEELERILSRALAKNPEDRHPTAGALHQELTAYLDRCKRVTPKMIGERVTELFGEERKSISQVIRQAMTEAAHAEVTGNLAVPLIPDLNQLHASADSKSQRFEPKADATAAPTTAPIPYSHRYSGPPVEALPMNTMLSKRSRWVIAGLFVLGVSALTAGLVIWVQRPPADAEVEVLAASSDPTAPAPSVRVSIRVSPSAARLILDGHVLGNGSYEGEHSRDNAEHTLDVDSPGHASRTLKLRFDRDLNLEVRLSEDSVSAGSRDERARAPVVKAAKPAAPPRGAAARDRNPSRNPGTGEQGDPYGDFPPPKRAAPAGQNFDTSNPWE